MMRDQHLFTKLLFARRHDHRNTRGAQVGYNMQVNHIVLGLEGDADRPQRVGDPQRRPEAR